MRLASGIPGFDDLIQGGIPKGSAVILQGPPGQEKLRLALTFLAEGLKAGASGLIVIASQSPDSILGELRNQGVDLDAVVRENRIRIVDWYSQREEPVQEVEERGVVLRSSIDLTNVGVALSRAIAALGGDHPKRAVVELLSPATSVYEVSQVYAFAQSSKGKFARFDYTALFLLEKEMHGASELTSLHQPFDGVIEVERTRVGDRIVRKIGVLHLRDTNPDSAFHVLEITGEGLRVTRDDPAAKAPPAPRPAPAPSPRKVAPPAKPAPAPEPKSPETKEESPTRAYLIMQIARERLKLNPDDPDALFAMAAAQATLDDARGALDALDRLARVDERYPGLWVLKTKLHARLGESQKARESRERAEATEPLEAERTEVTVACPLCDAPVSETASTCPKCGARFLSESDMAEELDALGQAAIQEKVKEELGAESLLPPEPGPRPPKREPSPPQVMRPPKEASKPAPRQGLTNGLVRERVDRRSAGMTNGLRGRTNGLTNGLRGRTNGLTNGLRGRTNGLTNGLRGRTNGLTNGLTNGMGHTNGLTNGLVSLRRGLTNGLTNGNGFTNGLGSPRFQREVRLNRWKLYVIPIVAMALLIVPLFAPPEDLGRSNPIQIDGQFDDWPVQSLVDIPGAGSVDPNIRIVRFGVTDNVDYLAFYVEVVGTLFQGGGGPPGIMDTVWLFLDTDNSSATGYRVDGIGADRLIEVSGYGGLILRSGLQEFDANRDVRDWNGWAKGTSVPAAVAGSKMEVEAAWIDLQQASAWVRAAVRAQSWDGQTDEGGVVLSPTTGTLFVEQRPVPPTILSGSSVPLLSLTATAFRQAVSFDSLRLQIVGTAPPDAATSLAVVDSGGGVLDQVVPVSRDIVFRFSPEQVDASNSRAYTVLGSFSIATGDTYGVEIASASGVGALDGIATVRTLPSTASLGYVGVVPANPRVDGGFSEWTSALADSLGESTTGGNVNIDLAGYGALRSAPSLYLYADVSGRIFTGTGQPVEPRVVTPNAPAAPDTDRDSVPDSVDPMPYDFNNDGIPDAQTNGDYDADGITDYGFAGGTDYWLNTTLPGSFPAPYAGLSVSVYIGPTYKPPLLGEDVLRVFLDIDNSSFSGYSIGGLGADRLVEIRGKDGQVSQSAFLSFSGSFPGEWSWSPISPVTVALGYHAVEFSVPGNATGVYVETGDFWGSVDSSASLAVFSAQTSFKVAASTTILSVPWAQTGPAPSAIAIDGGSNAPTTLYNHQRKVVRAGDVAGQTACDATNADGCWYAIFYDQLTQTSNITAPSTENVTTGSKVTGTFPSGVDSSNNVYIQYREANTGSTTVSSKNPTATGTSPPCQWTACASGETSDNTYTTNSNPNKIISFKTFGFAVPSGATITQVRIGIEAFQASGGDDQLIGIKLSWNGGSTYCSNTLTGDPYVPPNTGDPNSYAYFNTTTCTGHTWAQADFASGTDNIAFQATWNKGTTGTTMSVDAVVVEVTYIPAQYQLSVRYDWTSVPAGNTVTLRVEAYHSVDENFNVQVLTPPSTWNSRITVTATADPNTAQEYVLTTNEFNSGAPSVRFVDATGADGTQSDIWIDMAVIATSTTISPSTETLTTGSKVSGTFPTDVSFADATYIRYREANTGTTTVSSKNPTAIGQNPDACAWTNCASGETSNNAYATTAAPNNLLSFKTFGFAVPSGATINQVRIGIEAFQDSGGDDQITSIKLSWNAGVTWCSNTLTGDPFTPVTTGDPNAYTYFNTTTCTGHTWAQADFASGTDNIHFRAQYTKIGAGTSTISVDAVVVEVTYIPAQYQLSVRYDWTSVPAGSGHVLAVKGYRQDENISVQVLTPPSTWTTRITISATSNTQYTYSLTTTEYNSGSPAIRFVDAAGADVGQSDLWLDRVVIITATYWDRVILMRSADTSGATWGSQVILASGLTGDNPLLYANDSAEPAIAMDSAGYLHIVWVSAGSSGDQQTLNRVRYTKSTVAYPTQSQLASAANWQSVTVVDDASLGYMPTVSTGTSNYPHLAWSGSKTSGTVYYKNMYGGAWKSTVSWGTTYTGISVDVSPTNNYVNLVRYYEAATNEIQYTVCKDLASSNCDATAEFTKWNGTAGNDTVATSVESGGYPSLATTYEANGDLWIAYAKDVDGSTRAIYARFLDYPSNGYAAAGTVDSLAGTRFTRPAIGVDNSSNVHALYVAVSGPQLYYKLRTGGSWSSRSAIDTSSDFPSLLVRAPNDATYGTVSGAIYWKSSTSETFFYIPEFENALPPIASVLALVLGLGLRARTRKKGVPRH